jgi:hypothetical protein
MRRRHSTAELVRTRWGLGGDVDVVARRLQLPAGTQVRECVAVRAQFLHVLFGNAYGRRPPTLPGDPMARARGLRASAADRVGGDALPGGSM